MLYDLSLVVHHGPLRPAVGTVVHICTIVPLNQTIFFPHHSASDGATSIVTSECKHCRASLRKSRQLVSLLART